MNHYPTATDLRKTANEAILAKCDDPHLGPILDAALKAASQGTRSCRLLFEDDDAGRMHRLDEALDALGLKTVWMPAEGGMVLILSWA